MQDNESTIKLVDVIPFGPDFDGIAEDGFVSDYFDTETNFGVHHRFHAIINNVSVPDYIFFKLMKKFPDECAKSPRVTMINLWQLWDIANSELIIRNSKVHVDLCELAFSSGVKSLVLNVLSNQTHRSTFSRRALLSEDSEIQSAALCDTSLAFSDVEPFLEDDREVVRSAAVCHPSVPSEVVLKILDNASRSLRASILKNQNLPVALFEKYRNDWLVVRLAIASNPGCPDSLLIDFVLNGKSENEIVYACLENPALSTRKIQQIFDQLSWNAKRKVLESRELDLEFLQKLANDYVEIMQADDLSVDDRYEYKWQLRSLCRNLGITTDLLNRIYNTATDTETRINILSHPNVSPDLLLKVSKEFLTSLGIGDDEFSYYQIDEREFEVALANSNLDLNQAVGDYNDESKTIPGFELRVKILKDRKIAEYRWSLKRAIFRHDHEAFQKVCLEMQDLVDLEFWNDFFQTEWPEECIHLIASLPRFRLSDEFWRKYLEDFEKFTQPKFGDFLGIRPTLFPQSVARNVVNNPFAPEKAKELFRPSL